MKIVVAARCYNNVGFVERFLRGYDFADRIVVSDGGSTDGSVEVMAAVKKQTNLELIHFSERETVNGHTWNPDAPHMNFVLDHAKSLDSDWIIFDDFDCVPNAYLRNHARKILESVKENQVNVFRLYLWGDDYYFPEINKHFDDNYRSVWAWQPKNVDIHADPEIKHGTLVGLTESFGVQLPCCLLHKSWHPDTVQEKIDKYNAVGLPMEHPLDFAGTPIPLPEWAHE